MPGNQIETKSIAVFYSYMREDKELLTELDKRLIMLKREGLITVWSDQMIIPGENEADAINAHLNAAQLILLLISSSYIENNDCYAQMQRACERERTDGIIVLPVLARSTPGLQNTPVAGWKMLPPDDKPIMNWTNRDLAYSTIADSIRRVVERLQPGRREAQPGLHKLNISLNLLDSAAIYPRTSLVQEVYRRLSMADTSALVLTGMGGIGKSTLAILVLKYAEEQRLAGVGLFTDQALHLKLNPAATLLELLEVVRLALDMPTPNYTNLAAQDQASELFNILYRCDTPRLIVLDQFDAWLDPRTGAVRAEQAGVAEWLDSINGRVTPCRLLLTSRIWPQGAQIYEPLHMQDFSVRGLQKDEGVTLLHQRGLQDSDVDLALAVERCRGLPMALVLLDKLRYSQHIKLATLLNDPAYRQLWIEDVSHNLFDSIYEQQLDANQRDLLFAFSVYRTPIPKHAAQAITQNKLSQEQVAAALHTLQSNGLLQRQSTTDESYELHPLITEFVRQRFLSDMRDINSSILNEAHIKAAQYYIRQFALKPQSQQRWGIEDIQYLIEAIWHYCQAGQKQVAYDLIIKERVFIDLQRWGRNTVLLELYVSLLPSLDWQPVPEQAGRIYNEIGDIYSDLGQKDKAQQYFEQALTLFRQNGLRLGEVKALINLGAVYRFYNHTEQALSNYREAIRISDEDGDYIHEKGILLHNIGKVYQSLGRQEKVKSASDKQYMLSLEYYEQALAFYGSIKDSSEEARTQNNIGEVYAALGQYDKAQKYYQVALDVFLDLGERRGEGIVYGNLGMLYRELKQEQSAFEYYTQALAIFREIGDRWEEASVLKNLGRLFYMDAHYDAAIACFWLAGDIADAIHKNADVRAVPNGMRRFLGEEEFERLWSQAEVRAARILDQAIRAGINTDVGESADADGLQEK